FYTITSELYDLTLTAKERLLSRIAEHTSLTDLNAFIPQWKNDHHFGRAIIWQREHPEAVMCLSKEDKLILSQLTDDYRDLF
ncbi:hypothetical protein, partial [Shewanella sp. T24-MNA-CIBAN-0130]